MTWRGPKTAARRDPLLHGTAWRQIRKHWLTIRIPRCQCGVCGGLPIDYDGPQYLIIRGRKRQNPNYLIVGHIVSRYQAKRLGWSEAQINALTNTRPERAACSNRSGAQLGQRVQRVQQAARAQLDTS